MLWLLREYIKKWGKSIFFFFLAGLAFFFLLRFTSGFFINRIPTGQNEIIGIVGAYTLDNLPSPILYEISRGLTTVSGDGKPMPDLAKSWKITDNGKTYVFTLKNDVYFSDGTNLNSLQLNYNFSDASIERPDKYTVIFKLKEVYAPFLVTVSRPIFKKGFVGVADFKVKDIKLNGNFVESMTLVSVKNRNKEKSYHFYPSQEALKTAYVLGEVSQISGTTNINFKNTSLDAFSNTKISKTVNYDNLVTLFYNTQDSVLSDKKIRNALSYAIPDSFSRGERSDSSFPPTSWAAGAGSFGYKQDFSHANLLMAASNNSATRSASPSLQIKVLQKYKETGEEIASSWKKIGINTKIEVVANRPSVFQVFLGDFNVPKDPDQYTLWHSSQENNITNYKNLRIDKLLEDGRKTVDINERKKIYADFLKYFLDDAPASFLYFPFEYTIIRR